LHAATELQTAHNHAAENMGELIASATNVALAIELYLKALLLRSGQAAPMTHELPSLFAKLPSSVQLKVEQVYERLQATAKKGAAAAFAVHVAGKNSPRPRFGQGAQTQDNTLKGVLQRAASAFVTWRYLFAHAPTESGAPLTYEFLRLSLAAQALREQFGSLIVSIGEQSAP
jgi:hypothetical protein